MGNHTGTVKRFASVTGPSVILVVASVMLFASLTSLVLAVYLQGQLKETQGQLQDVQGQLEETQGQLQKIQEARAPQQNATKGGVGPAARGSSTPSTTNKSGPQDNAKNQSPIPQNPPQEGQEQQRTMVLWMQGYGNSSLPYLLLESLGLVVLASLGLVVTSTLALLFGNSRSGGSKAGSRASTPSYTGNPDSVGALEGASIPEDRQRWMELVEECVEVVDELDEHMDSFDAPRREVAGHVILRLEEILGRSGVEIISNDATFDRARHKPDADHVETNNGAAVHKTLSPGFAVGPRVLRRARVQLE